MKSLWVEKQFTYDGSQLRSHFAYHQYQVLGDSVVAWRGPCNVSPEKMVDGEDWLAGEKICGSDMLHFIVEKFQQDLFTGVALQRLVTCLALETIQELCKNSELLKNLRREGDDIFAGSKKFSISVATKSPLSILLHFAVNVSTEGTPVPTVSLQDFDIPPLEFAKSLLKKIPHEFSDMLTTSQKVRWVP